MRFPGPALIRSEASRERLLPDRAVVEVVVVEVLHLEDALQRGVPGGDALSWRKYPNRSTPGVRMISRSASLVSVAVQAIRQGSWEPVITAGWIPAVIVAAWPGTYRRCLPRRHGQAG